MPNNDLLLYRLLYRNEISAVIHDILRGWRLTGQLCALFKPVSSIDQGHINDVFTVSKRPQRNAWWICGYLRAQAEIFPSYLHRPGSNQKSLSCFRVYVWYGWVQLRGEEVEWQQLYQVTQQRLLKEVEESGESWKLHHESASLQSTWWMNKQA